MRVFCPLCQEFVELDKATQTVYRLKPKKHKCTECYVVTKQGITGWRPAEKVREKVE